MRKVFLLLTFLLFIYSEAISQNTALEETDPPRRDFLEKELLNRYQIGINTQFVIDGIFSQSIRTPIEILVRRQGNADGAYRLRVSGILQNSRTYEFEYFSKTHQSEIGLAIGYEWQKMISKRWNWYYGFELEGRKLWHNEMEKYNVVNQYTEENFHVEGINNQSTDRLSFLPLVGFMFQITPSLFVSTEFKLEAFTENQQSRSGYDVRSINAAQEYSESVFEDSSVKGNHINFQPFTGIFINFKL
jgi:hypothetical protein